ncbi:MAG: fibronectin type III domain-containing protein [Spirochaetales bacterium]|nr:fibronectin type III domain-containing protein [Spirochaetales bacterium]
MKNIFIILTSFLLLINNLYANISDFSKEKIEWRGENILLARNINILPGIHDKPTISLQNESYKHDDSTDLLVHFEEKLKVAGAYTVLEFPEITDIGAGLGQFSGYFSGSNKKLVLRPEPTSIFHRTSKIEDFTLEFRLNPSSMGKKETIFHWSNAYRTGNKIVNQFVTCTISDRKINWMFYNFFNSGSNVHSINLSSYESLIPYTWSHHAIRFDSISGKLEYLKDNIPQDIKFITTSSHEGGTVFLPKIGEAESQITFGDNFTGKLDEIRIQNRFETSFLMKKFKDFGFIVTNPIDLQTSDSILTRIETQIINNNNSDVFIYYRTTEETTKMLTWYNTNEFFQENYLSDSLWTPIANKTELRLDGKGRYIQFLFELLPGTYSEYSPIVGESDFFYIKHSKPLPPMNIKATPGDGKVTLTWNEVGDPNIAGYRIYYGTAPGFYFGEGGSIGSSPADIGDKNSITIENLKNGTLYFFAVVAYDKASVPNFSNFSTEVSARPAKVYRTLEQE